MKQLMTLAAQARAAGKKARELRREGLVPCVLYGNEAENTPLQCEYNAVLKTYEQAGESTLVELDAAGKKIPVLFHMVDFDPVTDRISHVDFYAVNMKKEIETYVPVRFTGEAPAVKELGGVLVTVLDHVTVRCLPADLPHEVHADISSLKEFDDHLTVADLVLPERVTVVEPAQQVIASAQEPRRIEEETPAAPAEGEAAAAEGAAAPAEGAEGAEKKAEKKTEKKEA